MSEDIANTVDKFIEKLVRINNRPVRDVVITDITICHHVVKSNSNELLEILMSEHNTHSKYDVFIINIISKGIESDISERQRERYKRILKIYRSRK